jgi:hypothetical protein
MSPRNLDEVRADLQRLRQRVEDHRTRTQSLLTEKILCGVTAAFASSGGDEQAAEAARERMRAIEAESRTMSEEVPQFEQESARLIAELDELS